jgi:tetratricopeptide (TPR) repeat protein
MSVKVANSRFITSSFKGLYRYLTGHLSSFQALGERIIHEAEIAQAFRQTEKLEELGSILSNFPIKEYRLVGQYYIGWCINRKGHDAQKLFEKVVEESATYRSMALIELATNQARKGDLGSGIAYYTEALKYSQTPYQVVLAERSIAAVKGIEGNHTQALKDLERIVPLVRYCQPVERYQYFNSYAVELIEAERIEEATNISRILLASPFAFAYPEWRETSNETERKGYRRSRSAVSVIRPEPENIFKMPIAESSSTSVQEESAKIFSLLEWKEKMGKEPNGEKIEELENMNERDLMVKLLYLATHDGVTEKKLRKVVEYALKVFSGPED